MSIDNLIYFAFGIIEFLSEPVKGKPSLTEPAINSMKQLRKTQAKVELHMECFLLELRKWYDRAF